MGTFIALLRAVNVGGTGRLPMQDLRAMCETAGFRRAETWIASGNVIFEASAEEAAVKATLEAALAAYAGKPVGVLVRNGEEMARVAAENPFTGDAANTTMVIFLAAAPPADTMSSTRGRVNERIALGRREIYVAYGAGMGRSKLVIPAAAAGTARNMNTVAKLAALAAAR